jgi:hypothetical protein
MTRQGQFMVYSQGAPKEEFDIISNEDYKLRLKKTWVEATGVWHIKFTSQSIFDHSFECFLTHEELKKLKDAL